MEFLELSTSQSIFIGVFVLLFAVYLVIDNTSRRKEKLQKLESRIGTNDTIASIDPNLLEQNEPSELALECQKLLESLDGNFNEKMEEIKKRMESAGVADASAPILYLFMKHIGRWALASFTLVLFLVSDSLAMQAITFLLFIFSILGTDLILTNAIQKRQQKLIRAFPDTLDLLLVCVESGLAIDAALARVCRELGAVYPEITDELNRTRMELVLLSDRQQALQNLAERTQLVPFRSLVATLIQTERFGTSLADTLRVISADYRNTRLMIAENKANRLPAMMTVPLIMLLMPSFMLVILAPPFLRVSEQGGIFGNR
jgi:tight adherence protein C